MWQTKCTIGMLYSDVVNKIIIKKPHQHATPASDLKKKLSILTKLNKKKCIKIHRFIFENEYTRTREHKKYLGIQHLSQKISFKPNTIKFTSKKSMPKIFITTFSSHPKPKIFLWNKHTHTNLVDSAHNNNKPNQPHKFSLNNHQHFP